MITPKKIQVIFIFSTFKQNGLAKYGVCYFILFAQKVLWKIKGALENIEAA